MKLNNRYMVEQVALQLDKASWPYVFAIPDSKTDDDLFRALSEKFGCEKVFRGNPSNVTNRIWEVSKALNLEHIMRITGDDPCHSSDLVNASISEYLNFKNKEYFSVIFDSLPDGLYHEIIPFEILNQLNVIALHDQETAEHVTIKLKRTKKTSLSKHYLETLDKYSAPNLKLSLDTNDDFIFLQKIFKTYPGNILNTAEVIHEYQNTK